MGEVEAIAKRIKGSSSKTILEKAFTEKCFAVGQGWEVVEKYISGQKGYSYGKTDTVPVVAIDEEKENLERTKPGT